MDLELGEVHASQVKLILLTLLNNSLILFLASKYLVMTWAIKQSALGTCILARGLRKLINARKASDSTI